MEFARSTWRLFAANARTAILFEFGFRFLFAILFVPACFGMAVSYTHLILKADEFMDRVSMLRSMVDR